MNKKIDELKGQYYENKDISDSELAEIEADLQEMEDRLEDLEERHEVKDCKSKNSCSVCTKRHHTLLHIFEAIPSPLQTFANELHTPAEVQRSLTPEHSNTFTNSSEEKKEKHFTSTAVAYTKRADGRLSPCKKLWVLKLEWDELLSNPIAKDWNDFVSTLPVIQNIHIPRLVIGNGRIILYGFADASSVAYDTVLYVHLISEEDLSSRLLCRKSRVAPVKPIIIHRLELCACVLLAQLLEKVLHSLTLSIQQIMLWAGSNIVLAWIQRALSSLRPHRQ
ncbi:uncharacterized protein TNCT_608831 [Trichonephila clavata]|uniref:Uncharacterized protein n=1 Tax=Trichonephila clavata TaxID=2740835 RepID=A0A8X6GKR9_TRICU|nr:uncharacterized protein TNCT_608831 [Trichonephila clavata]